MTSLTVPRSAVSLHRFDHRIRHSHAAALIQMNVAPKLLQERLGHERIQTTLDTYGHLYPNAQAEVAKQLEAFMSES